MFSFFKKKNKDSQSEVPDWATFFSKGEYTVFSKAVNDFFQKLNLEYKIDDGVIYVGENDFGFKQLGLHNLAQMCKQNNTKDYPTVIKDHFETMIRIHRFNEEFDKINNDFEKIEKYIGVRIYDREYAANLEKENLLIKEFAEGLVAMLIFDLPESVMNIKPEQIINWGKTVEELFEIGKKNIKKNYPVNLSEYKVQEHNIWFAEANHFFASSIAFDMTDYPQIIGKQGSLISFPNRHNVIIYPINSLDVIGVINHMLYLTSRMYEDGPGSLSDKIYWYNNGQYLNLPHRIENEKQIFAPPQEFVDALNNMAEKNNE